MSTCKYWDRRYSSLRLFLHSFLPLSSSGTFKELVEWEWQKLGQFDMDDVLDYGCGDLSLWKGRSLPKRYIGVDASKKILNHNRTRYPDRVWMQPNQVDYNVHRSRTVLCLNVLYHIVDELDYKFAIKNIAELTKETLIVSTWNTNPLYPETTDGIYQKYRDFEEAILHLKSEGLRVTGQYVYPTTPTLTMWVFKRDKVCGR